VGVEIELGRVEEEDLADLRLERIELERGYGRRWCGSGHRQLQLDAVGSLDQVEQLHEVLVREAGGAVVAEDICSSSFLCQPRAATAAGRRHKGVKGAARACAPRPISHAQPGLVRREV
jgi:hypothetical protein